MHMPAFARTLAVALLAILPIASVVHALSLIHI